ncbi:hypothetical protein M8J76_000081 [Diaphorina citri]|nr:hypothetical protein M8J75_001004 [Diaphorina citri]KAI5744204.1 hypothetical protein M8J76_000081 [Diaphorina citri]
MIEYVIPSVTHACASLDMVILAIIFVLQSFGFVGPSPHPSAPQNVTVTFLSPSSVRIAWMTAPGLPKVDHYDVNYKPSDAKFGALFNLFVPDLDAK